jgi:hypothetical protein
MGQEASGTASLERKEKGTLQIKHILLPLSPLENPLAEYLMNVTFE